jgi:hypothetical protein
MYFYFRAPEKEGTKQQPLHLGQFWKQDRRPAPE